MIIEIIVLITWQASLIVYYMLECMHVFYPFVFRTILMYHIVGNFRGRKLSRIVKTGRIMGVACLEFRGENFRRWLKNRKIRENFLPRKFPAIRYTLSCMHA